MKGDEKIAPQAPESSWTRPDAYVGAMARKRSYRRAREANQITQPVTPKPWLSTFPFVAILAMLAVLAVAIIFVAFPGNRPAPKPTRVVPREQGIAPRGWLQEAQKEMHR